MSLDGEVLTGTLGANADWGTGDMTVVQDARDAAGASCTVAAGDHSRHLDVDGRPRGAGRIADPGRGGRHGPRAEGGRDVRDDGVGEGSGLGGGVSYMDAASGLSIEAKARMLVAHADSDYEEWGARATARLDPGERGRGLLSLADPHPGRHLERQRPAVAGAGCAGPSTGLRDVPPRARPDGGDGLRALAARRPLHGHAQRQLRHVGRRGAGLPHRLASDLGGRGRCFSST